MVKQGGSTIQGRGSITKGDSIEPPSDSPVEHMCKTVRPLRQTKAVFLGLLCDGLGAMVHSVICHATSSHLQ